ncbi:hypothetical protein JOD01_003027 [Brevibacillus fulvus]|uniref:Transposase InsH N-terminal domain-containing protein n=1 Tax=Brevibacillus fulvus TaxID=1125967 RepID=A0A938Y1D2_9BACL|nr:hypothetical protein [Brevibacillus fulvus]
MPLRHRVLMYNKKKTKELEPLLQPSKQITASFHAELYKLIPVDHPLRKINEIVDFTFIHELVRSSYCEHYGRPANEPEP